MDEQGGRGWLPSRAADRGLVAQAVVDTVDVAILTCDADGRLNYCNSNGRRLLGLPAGPTRAGHEHADGDWPAQALTAVSTGEQLDGCHQVLHRALEEGHIRELELELVDAEGRPHRWLLDAHVLRAGDGSSLGAVCTAHDITALRDGERALQASERRFRAAFENGPLPMARLTPQGAVLETNPALRRLLSLTSARLVGVGLAELTHPADATRALAAVSEALTTGTRSTELRLLRADSEAVWCDVAMTQCSDGDDGPYLLAQLVDMTDRKRHELELLEASRTDPLTSLPNRESLADRLRDWLAPGSAVTRLALLFLDLDDFKAVNDDHGHDVGDAVLVEVAHRLRACVRPHDLVVRLGGDEFVIVCLDLPGQLRYAVPELEQRLTAAVRAPFRYDGRTLTLDVSVGSAVAAPGQDAAAVLADADAGMYRHKGRRRSGNRRPRTGPAPVRTQVAAPRTAELVATALVEDRLFVEYQPVHDLSSGQVNGAEALLRMRDRVGRTVWPDQFIPVAEASGAIVGLGEWVLRQAAAQAAVWKARLPADHDFAIGVNVSPGQLATADGVGSLIAVLEGAEVPTDAVVLEITEGSLLADTAAIRRAMDALVQTGVHLAVDDFGTGYASSRYLLTLPFGHIKIDRSYVAMLGEPGRYGAVAKALVQMATTCGLKVVAEGVETERQRALVLEQGCRFGQGFLFHRPLAVEAFDRLLAGTPPPHPRKGEADERAPARR